MPATVYAQGIPTAVAMIADCESGNGTLDSARQFYANGDVVLHYNKNGTFDIGYYQINSWWLPTARGMGINVYTTEGNIEFALWLMNKHPNYKDWSASKSCWDAEDT